VNARIGIVWLLDLHELAVAAEEQFIRPKGHLPRDEVALEARRGVVPAGHRHIFRLTLEDEWCIGQRRAAGPFADHSRIARGGERTGAEITRHEQAVGVPPGHPALGLRQGEASGHELLRFEIELPDHISIGSAAGEGNEAEPVLGGEHGGPMPDPVLALGLPEGIEIDHRLPGRLRRAILRQRRPPPEAAGMGGITPEVVVVRADLRHERDLVVGVENREQPGLQ
jgi:hypothetical protein